jgi:transcriptional regulator with XRE-family HTH domain
MPESATFPALIRQHRTQRGFSLETLAVRTGLAKTTLLNWEAGRTKPGVRELEFLLQALEVSPRGRLTLLRALALPRTLALIPESERPPVTGDLLRALRLRRGLSQSEVARRLEIRQGTLAKWEKSEDWPSIERLSALCAVLGARHEEVEVILSGVFLPLHLPQDATVETLKEASQELIQQSQHHPDAPLLDLHFLALESLLWFRQDNPVIHRMQLHIWQHHTSYLRMQRRFDEMLPYCEKLIPQLDFYGQVGVIHKAAALMRHDNSFAQSSKHHKKGIAFLKANQSVIGDPECQAWYWMELSSMLIEAGAHDDAWECIQRSNAIPHSSGRNRLDGPEARLSTIRNLVMMRRAKEGIALLESFSPSDVCLSSPMTEARRLLYYAKALIQLQDFSAAGERIRDLYSHVEKNNLITMRLRVDDVAQELENVMNR